MPNPFRTLLLRSPSLRKAMSGIYRHSRTTLLFGPARCVNVDDSFVAALTQPDSADRQALWTKAAGWDAPCPLAGAVKVLPGSMKNFAGKRVALLAHWDRDGFVDLYVWHYAEKLTAMGFAVVLATGAPLSTASLPSGGASPFAAVVRRDCPGYDFTSWKAALEAIPSLYAAEELFLTNDSIFAPVGDFEPIFKSMRPVACDAWGLVESHSAFPYLQSYGLVLRRNALRHAALAEFFARIPPSGERILALNHEQRFAIWLYRHGLSLGAWLPARSLPWPWFNPLHRAWRQLLDFGLPFIKRDMFLRRSGTTFPQGWQRETESRGYPSDLIANYLTRLEQTRQAGMGFHERSSLLDPKRHAGEPEFPAQASVGHASDHKKYVRPE